MDIYKVCKMPRDLRALRQEAQLAPFTDGQARVPRGGKARSGSDSVSVSFSFLFCISFLTRAVTKRPSKTSLREGGPLSAHSSRGWEGRLARAGGWRPTLYLGNQQEVA